MKKLLVVLLVGAMMAGLALPASAVPEPGVKKVTGITAVWNGEVPPIRLYWLDLEFTPENVTVTLSYADGSSKVLTEWSEDVGLPYYLWYLRSKYDPKASEATFYYIDSDLNNTYWNSIGEDSKRYVDADFLASLPQTSFAFPVTILDKIVADQQTPLKFNERLAVPAETDSVDSRVFSFTPKKSGKYYFYTQKTEANPYALLRDEGWNEIGISSDYIGNNFCLPARLEKGKTYYLFVGALNGYGDMTFDLVVSDKEPRMNAAQWIAHYLLGGWILARDNTISGGNFNTPDGLEIINYNAYVWYIGLCYQRFQNALDTGKDIRIAYDNLIQSFSSWPNITHGDG